MNEKRMADLEKQIERCENSIRSVYDRLDACENENIKAGADLHAGDGGYSIGTQKKYEEFAKARNYSMSETRIGQLVKECTTYYNGGGGAGGAVFDKEKFAELIIAECAQACMNEGASYEEKAAGAYQSNLYVTAIKQHFGVKE